MAEYRSQKTGPGAVIFFAVVALLFLILAVGKFQFLFGDSNDLTLYFESVNGVKERTPVSYAGRKCGEVRELRILKPEECRRDKAGKPYYVEIKVRLPKDVPINSDTKATISMVGMLGDKQIDLTPGVPNAPGLAPGEGLFGDSIGFEKLITTARSLVAKLEPLMDNLQGLMTHLNDVIKDPQFKDNLKGTIASARATLEKAQGTLEHAREMLGENRENIKASLANVRELTEKAKTTIGQLNETLGDTKPKIQATLENVQKLTGELRVKVDELMAKVHTTLDKTGATLDTARGILDDNRESIAMLMANLRDTGYNSKQFTHTLRLIFAPWSAFTKQSKPEPKQPEKPVKSFGRVKVFPDESIGKAPPDKPLTGSSVSEPARDFSKPSTPAMVMPEPPK
ncbi:MAG: MCE family protein [Verrucomicrobiae bacterium]|nr:MCE family protein [Verrucomicrobiae bacterium]